MFWGDVADIREADLLQLATDQIEESIQLEFKSQLNIDERRSKAEAAKDTSALANTIGGRIIFGIDEVEGGDGRKVAGALTPLNDATLQSRLEDVLVSSIQPRPRWRMVKVDLQAGGFVLIVEVYPSSGGDLYMVTGFNENRFYTRGEQRTVPMSESEIREAYGRIAFARRELDASLERLVQSEQDVVLMRGETLLVESVFVLPWFGHRGLVNPRLLGGDFGRALANGPLNQSEFTAAAGGVKVCADGFHGWEPSTSLRACYRYLAIHRNAALHLAKRLKKEVEFANKPYFVRSGESINMICAAVRLAKFMLDKVNYWGPVRVLHRLIVPSDTQLEDPSENSSHYEMFGRAPIPRGVYEHVVGELNLRELGSSSWIYRDLLDQLFQTGGRLGCPWYEDSGKLKPIMQRLLAPLDFATLNA